MKDLKYPQEYKSASPIVIFLEFLNQKEVNDPRFEAMFKQSGYKNISKFIISQDYYKLPERTNRVNGEMNHIFKLNDFRDVQTIYQDKTSTVLTPIETKIFLFQFVGMKDTSLLLLI